MDIHFTFRSNKTKGSTGKCSADRGLDEKDPGGWAPKEAQGEIDPLTGRAAHVGGSGKEDLKSRTAR